MKVKELIEQLKFIIKGIKFVAPMLLIVLLVIILSLFLEKNGLLEEFWSVFCIVYILSACYVIGKYK